jgi:hypothetical protein
MKTTLAFDRRQAPSGVHPRARFATARSGLSDTIRRLPVDRSGHAAVRGADDAPTALASPAGSDLSRISVHPPALSIQSAGDQPSEDAGRALAGARSNAAARSGALGGNASTMSTSDLSAADWKTYGEFKWWIKWVTDGTSGWIVQRIDNTYSGTLADGTSITNASVGVEPSYYEAWEVAANGTITGSLGATGNRDRWERPRMPNGSKGSWGMTGTVHWTAADPAKSGFTSGGVANAGSLLSKKTAPAGLSAALLTREAYGMWTSTGAQVLPGCWTRP